MTGLANVMEEADDQRLGATVEEKVADGIGQLLTIPQAAEEALEVAKAVNEGRFVQGAALVPPTKPVIDVATPTIVRTPLESSSIYTPG